MKTLTFIRDVAAFSLLAFCIAWTSHGVAGEPSVPKVDGVTTFAAAVADRKSGLDALGQAGANPADAAKLRETAAAKLNEALQKFTSAGDAFLALGNAVDQDWVLRCRCEQCDVLLRLDRPKDAAELAHKLIDDSAFSNSSLRPFALYQLGCAYFTLKDYRPAGRALRQLAPFDQEFGFHAQYMLSRIHHLANEFPEAGFGYKSLLANYDLRRKIADEALKNPNALKPDERARYEALVKSPPDYIPRAQFYSALILTEAGEFGEALAGFQAFTTQYPKHVLFDEAKLRLGYCYLQVKNYAEAVKALQPLAEHPQLGDRATWWLARASVGAADPANVKVLEVAQKRATELLSKAAEKSLALSASDPGAKSRRGDVLLELGDLQQQSLAFKDAIATYEKVIAEFANSDRAEMAMQREATALNLDGRYSDSDTLCEKFEKAYPKSILLPAIWFRSAENAMLSSMSVPFLPPANNEEPKFVEIRKGWEKGMDESIRRYQRLLSKFPEFTYVNLARYGLGSAQFQRGLYADSFETLSAVLDVDRTGELAHVNGLLGDCLFRQLPAETDDALQAAQLIDRAEQAARLLEKYAGTQGKTAVAADALLKTAQCYQRMGEIVVDPPERQKLLAQARQLCEKLMGEYGNTPSMPGAALERARVQALQGDINGAINEYNRFTFDPLSKNVLAPLAMIRQSMLLRTQNRASDALRLMTESRKRVDEKLLCDMGRIKWLGQIEYEQGLVLKDLGKLAEARPYFEKAFNMCADLNAHWRILQCRREELLIELNAARDLQKKPGAKPEEIAAASTKANAALIGLQGLAGEIHGEIVVLPKEQKLSDAQLWTMYEAVWCHRALADAEIESVRNDLGGKVIATVIENFKKAAPNQPVPTLTAPVIPLEDIPLQPNEKKAKETYESILAKSATSPVSARARLELAEMIAVRGQIDAALELLATGLEESPTADMAERLHGKLAACLLAKGEAKLAQIQAQAVLKNPNSPHAGEAIFCMGESFLQSKDWPNAIAQFASFRDKDPFRNMNALTERGLLRLGYTLSQAQRWDESRQAYEVIVQRFPQSAHVHDARFEIGAAWFRANQFDNAYNSFVEITRRCTGEIAARAQLQMGKCRLAQKRFPDALNEFTLAASIYNTPEISAEALSNAADVQIELKKVPEAKTLLQRIVTEFGKSKWAEAATKRLAEMK